MRLKVPFAWAGFSIAVVAQIGMLCAVMAALWTVGQPVAWLAFAIVCCLVLFNVGGVLVYRQIRQLRESARRSGLLAEMNVKVNRDILLNEDIELIYRTILNYLFSVFYNGTTGSILILDAEGYLTFAASRGFTEEFVSNFRLRLEDSFLYQLTGGQIEEARLITEEDFKRIQTVFKPGLWEYQSVISAPLFVGDKLFGLLNLDSPVTGTYDDADVEIVERFCTQIEVCLLARERYTANIKRYQVDALTGLLTRRYFDDLFKITLERSTRHQEPFVIALFDADGLKHVNDTYGHLAGDQMLLAIANALRISCRNSDIMARFGGDEFIASYLLTKAETMEKSIAGIRARLLAKPLRFGDAEHHASFSYGLASFPEDGADIESLIACADRRLYAMKSSPK